MFLLIERLTSYGIFSHLLVSTWSRNITFLPLFTVYPLFVSWILRMPCEHRKQSWCLTWNLFFKVDFNGKKRIIFPHCTTLYYIYIHCTIIFIYIYVFSPGSKSVLCNVHWDDVILRAISSHLKSFFWFIALLLYGGKFCFWSIFLQRIQSQ